MISKIMNLADNENNIKFDANKKLSPQEVSHPFIFILKEEVLTGFREVLYAHDIRQFKTMDEASQIFRDKMSEYRSQGVDGSKYEFTVITVNNRAQLAIEGVPQRQITEWVDKLNIPKE